MFLQRGIMQAIPHQVNTYPSRDKCLPNHLTQLLIKHHTRPGEKVCIQPEALMSQLNHWSPNDVCLEKRGYAASICLAQVTWRIALVSI